MLRNKMRQNKLLLSQQESFEGINIYCAQARNMCIGVQI
jgi:hypothetical protein